MKWADWEFIQPNNWNGADNGVLQVFFFNFYLKSNFFKGKFFL